MAQPRTRATTLSVIAIVGLGLALPAPSQASAPAQASARSAARPSGVTRLLPQVVQPGRAVQPAAGARVSGTVTFSPALRGRRVVIQRRVRGGGWQSYAVKRQNGSGVVAFNGPRARGGVPLIYRGVALRYRGRAAVRASSMSGSAWHLRFSDEFPGTELDPAKWKYRLLGVVTPRRTRSVSAREAVQVADGTARLYVKRDPNDPDKYLNGHIGTHDGLFSFTRGVAAARIRFQRGVGQHGAFWMLPDARRNLPGRPRLSGAEIDVAEYFGAGYDNGGLGSFVYNYGVLGPSGEPRRLGAVFPGATRTLAARDDWWKSYHVFSVEWTRDTYTFRVDGRVHWRTRAGVSGIPEHLILSLMTSDYEVPRIDNDALPSRMQVDWVRVWQR